MGVGFFINKDVIYYEFIKDNLYLNVFVVCSVNKDDEVVKILEKYYYLDEVKVFIEKEFNGFVVFVF